MIKRYIVYPKANPDLWYEIEAPTRRIAKWCGLNVIKANYCCGYTKRDMVVKRYRG